MHKDLRLAFPYLIFVILFAVNLPGCNRQEQSSEIKQIFTDQKRDTIPHSQAPYILSVGRGCTGFIIDSVRNIAISAMHCDIRKELTSICFGLERLYTDSWEPFACPDPGYVTEVIESSPVSGLDYVIFRYDFIFKEKTRSARSLKLAGTNSLQKLMDDKTPLVMVGYPSDSYQKTQLTASRCRVRGVDVKPQGISGTQEEIKKYEEDAGKLISAWENDPKYHTRSDYQDMRNECFTITSNLSSFRPSYKTDCSVYGGNSGGPILTGEQETVIGMPASYYQKPEPEEDKNSSEDPCTDKYWDIYFKPILGEKPPKEGDEDSSRHSAIWDKLDRDSSDITDFPDAIPMFLIVQKSAFLQKNRQYLDNP
ncbi:MAG: hypothetical protein HQK54_07630 [Oligoflexales bacterium]|nr:hypothetical protein [Oligoflexales bacterium]